MEPMGGIPLTGVNSSQPFFRTLLDRIGINFRTYSVGPWKSVNSMFSERDGWTQPQRENLKDLMSSLHGQLKEGIANARKNIMEGQFSKAKALIQDVEEGQVAKSGAEGDEKEVEKSETSFLNLPIVDKVGCSLTFLFLHRVNLCYPF
jgi:protease-4